MVDPFPNFIKDHVSASCEKRWSRVLIIDESKLVNYFGGSGLAMPVEKLFEEVGCVAKIRTFGEKKEPYVTNNGNFIVDLYFERSIGDLKVASDAILQLDGIRCCLCLVNDDFCEANERENKQEIMSK
ncbi:putative ribose-5-phosphate isomerase 1 [Glycine max]|nr:putative ribose-5-phosphate isomerase 1 [Glycine max]